MDTKQEATYLDETWVGEFEDCGQVGTGTFTWDVISGEFDGAPVRLMVEDEFGTAHAYLTIESAEQLVRDLEEKIASAKLAQDMRPPW